VTIALARRLRAAFLLLALATPSALAAQQPQRVELSGTSLTLYNLIGTLQVVPASGSSAVAEVTRQGSDGGKLGVESSGGTLRIVYPGTRFVYPAMGANSETSLDANEDGTFGDEHGGRRVKITGRGTGLEAWADVRLMLPEGARANLNVGVGKVTLTNVNGTISAQTASGDIETTGTRGSLTLDSGSGDVTLTGHDGPLSVDTGSGDILLKDVKTDALALDTGSGDVRVSGLSATQLEVDTGSGDVIVSGASVGVVNVDTGSGDIRLGLTSDLDELSVDTGSGDVELTAPASLGAQVDIETSSGDIDTQFPLQVTRQGHDGLKGTIGDGKGRITIETASGNVALRKQP
jgi:lia operon protein LiaG